MGERESAFGQEMARAHIQRLIDVKPDIAREYTISDLLHKIDPSAALDPLAEELVLDIADDFIDSIVTLAADSAKIRGSPTLQAEDVNYVIQRKFGDAVLGRARDVQRQPEFIANDAHLKRLRAVQDAQTRQPELPQ
jgi:transcription initiation factor TFIID subunit 12